METNKYISMDEFLMGRATLETLPKEYVANANILITKVNELLELFYKDNPKEPRKPVSSGYRTEQANKAAGGAKRSNHLTCSAIDLADHNKSLGKWCQDNIKVLEKCDLYMESLNTTHKGPGLWIHLQIVRPKSGNRIFIP